MDFLRNKNILSLERIYKISNENFLKRQAVNAFFLH